MQLLTLFLSLDFAFLGLGYFLRNKIFAVIGAILLLFTGVYLSQDGITYDKYREVSSLSSETNGTLTTANMTYTEVSTTQNDIVSRGIGIMFDLAAIGILLDVASSFGEKKKRKDGYDNEQNEEEEDDSF
jgi:hypothetical protein